MHVAIAGALSLALLLGGPPPGKGPKGKKGQDVVKPTKDGGFTSDQRAAFGSWSRGQGCPPGLAKKNNGCLPPGQAKKRYAVGRPLPTTVRWDPVPRDVLDRIGAPPRGYEYGIVDGDLVALAVGTRMVVDAIAAIVD